MNKEKTKELIKSFFSQQGEDITDADSVLSFYRKLNNSQNELGHEWYIEEVSSLGGGDISTVCTLWIGGIMNTSILDWEVNVCMENIEDLIYEVENLENKAQEVKTLLAKLNYK